MSAPGSDPTPEPTATPAEPTPMAAPPQPGPWSADLEAYFQDETARQAADRYMREKVQPRMTQLEQETAPARELWNDLLNDPNAVLATLVNELHGEEMAEKFAGLFAEGEPAAEPTPTEPKQGEPAAEPTPTEPKQGEQPLDPRLEAMLDWYQQQQGQSEYEQALASMRQAHTDLTDDDMNLIHPFVQAAGGDLDAAYQGYAAWKQEAARVLGTANPAAEAQPAEETPAAPPVLGGQAAAAAAPPTQKQYSSIDEAMDDWLAEQRQGPPPVVGNV